MVSALRISFALTALSLGAYVANHSSSSFSYTRASIYALLFSIPFQITWGLFLYPLYFSPLLALPQAPVSRSCSLPVASTKPYLARGRMEVILQTSRF